MKSTLHHCFDPYLAQEYGLEESILIHHFQYWIQLNIETNKNFHDGRYWTYQTLENISAHFPYLSRDQVNRTIRSLVDQKIIIKGNYNKVQFDRTVWYAFVNQEDFIKIKKCLPNGEIAKSDMAKSPNPNYEIATPIPDTKTDNKKNNKQASPEPAAAVAVFSCLKDVEITENDKEWLSGHYNENEVSKALSYCLSPNTTLKKSLGAALKWACKVQPEIPQSNDPEQRCKENLSKAKEILGDLNGKRVKTDNGVEMRFEICRTYFEIVGSGQTWKLFDFKENGCIEQIVKCIQQYFPSLRNRSFV